MAFAWVQDDLGTNDASGTVLSQAFTSNVVSGNLLIAVSRFEDADTVATLTSTRVTGNWTQVAGGNHAAGISVYLHYAIAESSGACTVTQTLTAASIFRRLFIHEYSGGLGTSAVFGKATQKFNVGANATCGPLERLTANELGFAAVGEDSGVTFAAAGGFTERQEQDCQTQDLIASATGDLLAQWTNAATANSVAVFALFRSEALASVAAPAGSVIGMGGHSILRTNYKRF